MAQKTGYHRSKSITHQTASKYSLVAMNRALLFAAQECCCCFYKLMQIIIDRGVLVYATKTDTTAVVSYVRVLHSCTRFFFFEDVVTLLSLLSHLNAMVTIESDYADHTIVHVQKGRHLPVRVLRDSGPCNDANATKRRRSINEPCRNKPTIPFFFRSTNNQKSEYCCMYREQA